MRATTKKSSRSARSISMSDEGYGPAAARLESTFVSADNLFVTLVTERPLWLSQQDARLTALSDVLNILRASRIALVVLDNHLVDPEWWRQRRGFQPSLKEASFDIYAFSQAAKNHLIFFTFSTVEKCFRLLLRTVAPGVANNATAEFMSVYTALLLRLPDVPENVRIVLELARLTRNCYHNGGIYRPRTGHSVSIDWQGYHCEFIVGKPIEFANWVFAADLANGLLDALREVFKSPVIQNIVDPVVDESALIYSPDA